MRRRIDQSQHVFCTPKTLFTIHERRIVIARRPQADVAISFVHSNFLFGICFGFRNLPREMICLSNRGVVLRSCRWLCMVGFPAPAWPPPRRVAHRLNHGGASPSLRCYKLTHGAVPSETCLGFYASLNP